MLKQLLFGLVLPVVFTSQVLGFGPAGHKLVGQIADELLKGKPAEAKVQALLNIRRPING